MMLFQHNNICEQYVVTWMQRKIVTDLCPTEFAGCLVTTLTKSNILADKPLRWRDESCYMLRPIPITKTLLSPLSCFLGTDNTIASMLVQSAVAINIATERGKYRGIRRRYHEYYIKNIEKFEKYAV